MAEARELDWRIYGGAHHGERFEGHPSCKLLRLPLTAPLKAGPLRNVPRNSDLACATYRLARFYTGDNEVIRAWMPEHVPDERSIAHVLGLALKIGKL